MKSIKLSTIDRYIPFYRCTSCRCRSLRRAARCVRPAIIQILRILFQTYASDANHAPGKKRKATAAADCISVLDDEGWWEPACGSGHLLQLLALPIKATILHKSADLGQIIKLRWQRPFQARAGAISIFLETLMRRGACPAVSY